MGGIAFRAPVLATMFLIVAFANLAMPGSSNFVGEFLILLGVFNAKIVIAIVAFTGVALASVYTLRLFIRAMHNRTGPDVESREISLRRRPGARAARRRDPVLRAVSAAGAREAGEVGRAARSSPRASPTARASSRRPSPPGPPIRSEEDHNP